MPDQQTIVAELNQEEVNFLNQILSTVQVNGLKVQLESLVGLLQKMNTPTQVSGIQEEVQEEAQG